MDKDSASVIVNVMMIICFLCLLLMLLIMIVIGIKYLIGANDQNNNLKDKCEAVGFTFSKGVCFDLEDGIETQYCLTKNKNLEVCHDKT